MGKSFGESTRGSLSAKFHTKGSYIVGIVLSPPVEVPMTDINSGKPLFWDEQETRPKTQWVFELLKVKETVCSCDEWCDGGEKNRAYGAEDDDGIRKMYVSSGNQIRAIAKAIRDAGVRSGDPEVGGTLAVSFTALDKQNQKPGRKPPKLFTAQYKRPTDDTIAQARAVTKSSSFGSVDDEEDTTPSDMFSLLDETPTVKPASKTDTELPGEPLDFDSLLGLSQDAK